MEILAQRMKKLRLENKMKQTEAAEALGISISAYTRYEYIKHFIFNFFFSTDP